MLQTRFTYQASQRNKFGVTYDLEALCSCPNQISATVSPEASVDRRFPLQRFVQTDWNSPVSSRLLLEASAIHRVERWGAMHLQTGKGDNIDAIAPGMVPVIDNPSLATGASLNYRAFATHAGGLQQLLELEHPLPGRRVLHHRVSQLQGWVQQRLRASREHQLHRPDDTLFLQLRERPADAGGLPDRAADGRGERGPRPRALCAGQVDGGPMDALGRRALRPLQEQLPAAGDCAPALAPNLNVQFDKIENYSLHDITPKLGATSIFSAPARRHSRSRSTSIWRVSAPREPYLMGPIPSIV